MLQIGLGLGMVRVRHMLLRALFQTSRVQGGRDISSFASPPSQRCPAPHALSPTHRPTPTYPPTHTPRPPTHTLLLIPTLPGAAQRGGGRQGQGDGHRRGAAPLPGPGGRPPARRCGGGALPRARAAAAARHRGAQEGACRRACCCAGTVPRAGRCMGFGPRSQKHETGCGSSLCEGILAWSHNAPTCFSARRRSCRMRAWWPPSWAAAAGGCATRRRPPAPRA